MRGKPWNAEWDDILRQRFADEANEVFVRELGIGLRTLERHASALGLKKSKSYLEKTQRNATRAAGLWFDYQRITGKKIKRKGKPGKPFEKGHHWDADTEKKRVEAIRDRAWDERRRLMHGMRRKTKWPMVPFGKVDES